MQREIVGIAGVSGNGQKELAEVLGGQRPPTAGEIIVDGSAYSATRAESRSHQRRASSPRSRCRTPARR